LAIILFNSVCTYAPWSTWQPLQFAVENNFNGGYLLLKHFLLGRSFFCHIWNVWGGKQTV